MSTISRSKLLRTVGLAGFVAPASGFLKPAKAAVAKSGGIYVPHVVAAKPNVYTSEVMTILRNGGITAFSEPSDGYIHYTNGARPTIAPRPACNITFGAPTGVRPLDTCDYEPGGGDDLGYPVIGSVVANPYIPPSGQSSLVTAPYTGAITNNNPNGPVGYIPQKGFGPKYFFTLHQVECATALGAQGGTLLKFCTQAWKVLGNSYSGYGYVGQSAELAVASGNITMEAELTAAIVAALPVAELALLAAGIGVAVAAVMIILSCEAT